MNAGFLLFRMYDSGVRRTEFDLISLHMKMEKKGKHFVVIVSINWLYKCVCCHFSFLVISHAFQPPVNKRDDKAEKPKRHTGIP